MGNINYVSEIGLVRVWTLFQYCLYGGSKGFSVVNNAFLMRKDYNTAVPIRRAMLCHLNKAITVEPRFNELLFNEVLDITNDILCPG